MKMSGIFLKLKNLSKLMRIKISWPSTFASRALSKDDGKPYHIDPSDDQHERAKAQEAVGGIEYNGEFRSFEDEVSEDVAYDGQYAQQVNEQMKPHSGRRALESGRSSKHGNTGSLNEEDKGSVVKATSC